MLDDFPVELRLSGCDIWNRARVLCVYVAAGFGAIAAAGVLLSDAAAGGVSGRRAGFARSRNVQLGS